MFPARRTLMPFVLVLVASLSSGAQAATETQATKSVPPVEGATTAPAATTAATTGEAAAAAAGTTEAAAPAVEAQKTGDETDPAATAVAKAIEGIGNVIAEALVPITAALKATNDAVAALTVKVEANAAEVEVVKSGQRQTRKSGDLEDLSANGTQNTAEDERARKRAERQTRGILGF